MISYLILVVQELKSNSLVHRWRCGVYFLWVTKVMQQFKGIKIRTASLLYDICSFFLQILIIRLAASSVSVWPHEHFVSHQSAFGYFHCSFCKDAPKTFLSSHEWISTRLSYLFMLSDFLICNLLQHLNCYSKLRVNEICINWKFSHDSCLFHYHNFGFDQL